MGEPTLQELLLKIESLRESMEKLISQKELKDPEILELSKQLDELLVKYYETLKSKQ
ncbi:aspartyl-phosphate phosphatase Spo0E family protein [Caldicoprobacter guelmensis]|uniref:aspartyl-phosphate phosphatase Spo0E family protein n=1 Tax=Caldicoprobacter guelmensis TaxID=1170224 RepID=UPI00195B21C6|nr:aspartyl-phosphate phosphatase Spo0E family protein [Caldicoprobacter guelmensis]